MSRRHRAKVRDLIIESKYNDLALTQFINKVMKHGKKNLARKIVYSALDEIETQLKKPGIDVFNQAVKNVSPDVILKSRRVGGANYQVPAEVRPARRLALAMRWIVTGARQRSGRGMAEKLSAELLDASRGQGAAVRRKEEVFRMAEANRAFAHYRW